MTRPLVFSVSESDQLAGNLAAAIDGELGEIETRRFPDEEAYLRLRTDPRNRSVVVVCTLDRPDTKILPLLFAAETARELGAMRVGLVAPYLAYMRQDRRFNEGEAITSVHFARLLSSSFDWLVTVDPHLHRYQDLDTIYSIPAVTLHAAPILAEWIRTNVSHPLLIGPDSESEQWVASVAASAGAPHIVLRKERLGDREVKISVPNLGEWSGRAPVLIDDIVSSARTMIETARHLADANWPRPTCIAVHPVFSEDSYRSLQEVAGRIASTNTIPHETNVIDITPLFAGSIAELLSGQAVAGRRS
ncbi:MAG: phosphoribosylpyrophosphate synthetase [Alphaproteobacteria bacterium]|jgi:ribose-phosphate pyrophosphokinase|nr:MAG: phosphoribosylpyrophosphate synthetase [Alphaproteobacteria bacterium]